MNTQDSQRNNLQKNLWGFGEICCRKNVWRDDFIPWRQCRAGKRDLYISIGLINISTFGRCNSLWKGLPYPGTLQCRWLAWLNKITLFPYLRFKCVTAMDRMFLSTFRATENSSIFLAAIFVFLHTTVFAASRKSIGSLRMRLAVSMVIPEDPSNRGTWKEWVVSHARSLVLLRIPPRALKCKHSSVFLIESLQVL